MYVLTANGLFRLYKRQTSIVGGAVEMNQPQLIDTMKGLSNE